MFAFGIENFLENKLFKPFEGKRIGLLAHQASVDKKLRHSLDLLKETSLNIVCAFGPQHGMRGEKQDNMIESDDYVDPKYHIPVYSLYGKTRKPTSSMLQDVDVILVDLQEVGNRIYTYIATLVYMMDACERWGKALWVLDRPNPVGRPVEGLCLQKGFETFVGVVPTPMRHGLTLGEFALWYKRYKNYSLDLEVVPMLGYDPTKSHEWGWPAGVSWVNPSPNLPRLSACRMYAGTVLLEGTLLSEGRGTTIPLEVLGAPVGSGGVPLTCPEDWVKSIHEHLPSSWLEGALLRPCYFEPVFQKHAGHLCGGFQIHVDHASYDHNAFKPFRLVSGALKVFHKLYPDYELWRKPPYEYEEVLMPFDILSGSDLLRKWISDKDISMSSFEWLDDQLVQDENAWKEESQKFWLY